MSDILPLTGLPPLIDGRSRILVLGSFPSVKSLEASRYYGNPMNHFWGLVATARSANVPAYENYEARCEWLLSLGLALWDTIGECLRPGSLDQNIRAAKPNDIANLLQAWPQIKRIILNGGSAAQIFDRQIAATIETRNIQIFKLPSSSPIPSKDYRRMEDKLTKWSAALTLETLP